MKAILKTVGTKKIVGINVENFKTQIEEIAEINGCEFNAVDKNCGDLSLQEICESEKNTDKQNSTSIEESILIFSGLGGRNLDRILNILRTNNVIVDLKAVVTQYNKDWKVSKLRDEIKKEHELMNNINGGGQNG